MKNIYDYVKLCGPKFILKKLKDRIVSCVNNDDANIIDVFEKFSFVLENKRNNFSYNDYIEYKNNPIILNWVIPELGIGSGGHINIFRFIEMLSRKGISNRIYIYNPVCEHKESDLLYFIRKYYDVESDNISFGLDVNNMDFCHGIVATSWQTAYFVNRFDNTLSKFYFVQDFEPYFYPSGSQFLFAENTYKFGLMGLTAGYWLKEKLFNEYNMKCTGYMFSYDKKLYKFKKKLDNKKRVFFYFRPSTDRRATEMGLMALSELKKRMSDLEIWFAGADTFDYHIPFSFKNLGILKIEQLCDIYSQCDMCLVLSTTNLSLLPLEIMASNSIVVSNRGANNEWFLNEYNSILVDNDPVNIADRMLYYFNNIDEMNKIRESGRKFAESTSWEESGNIVYNTIVDVIENSSSLRS